MMFSISNEVRAIECFKREMKYGTETIIFEIKQLQTFINMFIKIWKVSINLFLNVVVYILLY